MPRMPKYLKEEWAFFLDERGRKKYNELCRKCERSCKQSFRATVIQWRATVSCTPSKSKKASTRPHKLRVLSSYWIRPLCRGVQA